MKKIKFASLAVTAAMLLSSIPVLNVGAALSNVYTENFESFEIDSTFGTTSAVIKADPDNEDNKVAFIPNTGSAKIVLDKAISGDVEVKARMRTNKDTKSNFALRVSGDKGDIAILRLGCINNGTTKNDKTVYDWESWVRIYAMLTPDSENLNDFGDAKRMNPATLYRVSEGQYGASWKNIRMIIHTASETCDVYISGAEITDEMIQSKEGVDYCEGVPFYTAGEKTVTGITLQALYLYNNNENVYFDDLSVAESNGSTEPTDPTPTPSVSPSPSPTAEPTPTVAPIVTPIPENLVYGDNFESYDVDSNWMDNTSIKIKNDPVAENNKVALIKGSGGQNITFDSELSGKISFSARVKSMSGNNNKSNFALKVTGNNGDIALMRLGCLTVGQTINGFTVGENYNRFYALLTPDSGAMTTDSLTINSSTVYGLSLATGNWENIRMIVDTAAKTCDVYIASTDITDDMIEEKSGLRAYCTDIPFYSDSTEVTGIGFIGNWIYDPSGSLNNMYFDDIAVCTQSAPVYAVKNASYTIHDGKTYTTVQIKKGEGNAVVYTALYDENNMLLAVNADNINESTELTVGKYTMEKEFALDGVKSVKVMMWDSNMTSYGAAIDAAYTEYQPPAEPPKDDLWDVEIPAYEFADVERADVPQIVAAEDVKQIPDEVAQRVKYSYPEGKKKAFLLSFDDGPNLGDCQLLIPLFNENNLNAAFNLNPNDLDKGMLFDCVDGQGIWVDPPASNAWKEKVYPLYERFEIGNHGKDHKPTSMISKQSVRAEIGQGKYNCEIMMGKEAAGYINSWKDGINEEEKASAAWTAAYTKYTGHRYVRNAPIKNNAYASTPSGLNFDVSDNFMSWNPTVQDAIEMKDSDGNVYHINDIMNYFVNTDMGDDWKVYFIWGHSTDMSRIDWKNYTYSTNQYFEYFKDVCTTAKNNADILWNATPIDFVDYVNASRLTEVSVNGDKITIYNPSKSINVWMTVDGTPVKIAAGESVEI